MHFAGEGGRGGCFLTIVQLKIFLEKLIRTPIHFTNQEDGEEEGGEDKEGEEQEDGEEEKDGEEEEGEEEEDGEEKEG